jgi:aryl-alcohol dehydrogenase-like predicted oxidoreductase
VLSTILLGIFYVSIYCGVEKVLADIYGPAEDFVGKFRLKLSTLKGKEELNKIQALTKWVPQPRTITRSIVNENIEKSLHRMSVNSLDLLQFHWWDYDNPYYMDALRYLSDLRDKGRIKYLGLTILILNVCR